MSGCCLTGPPPGLDSSFQGRLRLQSPNQARALRGQRSRPPLSSHLQAGSAWLPASIPNTPELFLEIRGQALGTARSECLSRAQSGWARACGSCGHPRLGQIASCTAEIILSQQLSRYHNVSDGLHLELCCFAHKAVEVWLGGTDQGMHCTAHCFELIFAGLSLQVLHPPHNVSDHDPVCAAGSCRWLRGSCARSEGPTVAGMRFSMWSAWPFIRGRLAKQYSHSHSHSRCRWNLGLRRLGTLAREVRGAAKDDARHLSRLWQTSCYVHPDAASRKDPLARSPTTQLQVQQQASAALAVRLRIYLACMSYIYIYICVCVCVCVCVHVLLWFQM